MLYVVCQKRNAWTFPSMPDLFALVLIDPDTGTIATAHREHDARGGTVSEAIDRALGSAASPIPEALVAHLRRELPDRMTVSDGEAMLVEGSLDAALRSAFDTYGLSGAKATQEGRGTLPDRRTDGLYARVVREAAAAGCSVWDSQFADRWLYPALHRIRGTNPDARHIITVSGLGDPEFNVAYAVTASIVSAAGTDPAMVIVISPDGAGASIWVKRSGEARTEPLDDLIWALFNAPDEETLGRLAPDQQQFWNEILSRIEGRPPDGADGRWSVDLLRWLADKVRDSGITISEPQPIAAEDNLMEAAQIYVDGVVLAAYPRIEMRTLPPRQLEIGG